MASLRRTRRFSPSPTPEATQRLRADNHNHEGYYHDSSTSDVPEPSGTPSARENSTAHTVDRSKSVKKARSSRSPLVQKSSRADDNGELEDDGTAFPIDRRRRDTNIRDAAENKGKTTKKHIKDANRSLRSRRSSNAESRLPGSASGEEKSPGFQPPSFFAAKAGHSQSRSSSPGLTHISRPYDGASLSPDPRRLKFSDPSSGMRPENKIAGVTPSVSTSSSEDASNIKKYHTLRLRVPPRAASPLPPTLNVPESESSRTDDSSRSGHSPSLAMHAAKRAFSPPSMLPVSTRRDAPTKPHNNNSLRQPSRDNLRSHAPLASLVSSPSPLSTASSAPRTLKDVTRLLEERRGTFPKHQPHRSPRKLEAPVPRLNEISFKQAPALSTLSSSENRTAEPDGFLMLGGADNKSTPLEQIHHSRPRYGLALMNENGRLLGMPTSSETYKNYGHSDASSRSPAHSSKSHSSKNSADKIRNLSTSDSDAGIPDRLTREEGLYASQPSVSTRKVRDNSANSSKISTGSRGDGMESKERGGWRLVSDRYENMFARNGVEPASSSQRSVTPSSTPKAAPRPTFLPTKSPVAIRSAAPSLSASGTLEASERQHIQKFSDSDASSSSVPRLRKLVIRNPDSKDRGSSPSSTPGTPKSISAVDSRDLTIMAVSGTQTSLSQFNQVDYIVPDEIAVEVTNDEERRRKALQGLVHDLHLTDGDLERRPGDERHKGNRVLDSRDGVISLRETRYERHGDDDDAFFAKLNTHEDGSLFEVAESQTASGFRDGDYTDDERSEYDEETELEAEGGEELSLPPTPVIVHPQNPSKELETRITRVASLNQISPAQFVPRLRAAEQERSLQPRREHMQKPTISAAKGVSAPGTGTLESQGSVIQHDDSGGRVPAVPSPSNLIPASPASYSSSSDTDDDMLRADTELSLIGSGRLPDICFNAEESLSSGAEALFRRLKVEADAQDTMDAIADKKQASSDQQLQNGVEVLRFSSDGDSTTGSAERRSEDQSRPSLNNAEPMSLLTWRSTLPTGAYDSLAERHGALEMRRQEVIWELCQTEQAFVKSLRLILRLFVQPLRHEDRTWIPGVPRDVALLFDWFDDIMHLHSQISSALHSARSSQYPLVIQIAETLRPFVPRLELHQPYLVRLESVSAAIEAMSKDVRNDFGEFVRIQTASPECESMNLPSFLLKPVQRLMKYPLFFKQLWELTPRNHPDHLPTFSLLHSTDMIIRVMQEVKCREEEYELVKNLASRIKGLPPGYQLARRERRLIAQGSLRRVILSDQDLKALDTAAAAEGSKISYHTSISQMTSASSGNSSSADDWATRAVHMAASGTDRSLRAESSASETSFDSIPNMSTSNSRSTSRSGSSLRGSLSRKSKENPVYVFVFTDLMILTTPMSDKTHLLRSPKNVYDGKEAWRLIEHVGVSRVLGVTDISGQLQKHRHLIAVELMSMTPNLLETGTFSDGATATAVYFSIPNQTVSSATERSDEAFAEVKWKWLDAFERCFRFTLRSLSFPSYFGKYSSTGQSMDLESDTKTSVMSILSSGLPLPISPSQQLDEAQRGRQPDLVQEEREERGWWSLRFHQVLKEVQRSYRSPVFDTTALSGASDMRIKRQVGKRSEPRPFILSPKFSSGITPPRKGGLLSLGKKVSK